MNYTAEGVFMGHQVKEIPKKDGTGTFLAGDVLIEIDNSWTKRSGEKVIKKSIVPFNAYGTSAQAAQLFKFGEPISVSYEIEGREYTDKNGVKRHFVQCKALFFTKKEESDNIPFPESGKQDEQFVPDEKLPWEK